MYRTFAASLPLLLMLPSVAHPPKTTAAAADARKAQKTMTTAPTPAPSTDNETAERFASLLQSAWNSGDAKAFAAPFTPEALFTNVRGDVFRGRQEIETRHARIFETFYRGSHTEIHVDGVTSPLPDLLLFDLVYDVTKYAVLPPGISPTEPGLLRARMKMVAIRRGGEWQIVAAQNTAIPPKLGA